jgi:hypothetical protein
MALSLGVKQQRLKPNHSNPSTGEVRNIGAVPSLSHMPSKHRDNFACFTFNFYYNMLLGHTGPLSLVITIEELLEGK